MILIHHIGAKSGIERVTPLACAPQGHGHHQRQDQRSLVGEDILGMMLQLDVINLSAPPD